MSVKTYRKIPVEVEVVQYTPYTLGECVQFLENNGVRYSVECTGNNGKTEFMIDTLEGCMTVSMDDYIIRGVKGECYPCKPDIFEKNIRNGKGVLIMNTLTHERRLPHAISRILPSN